MARGLRHQGIELAIDDFGAGYATYHFLDAWDWSLVKINRGLIRAHDRCRPLLLRHVASLLTDVGARSVAEGIETARRLPLVTELGIDYARMLHRPTNASPAAILDLAAAGWLTETPWQQVLGGQPRGSTCGMRLIFSGGLVVAFGMGCRMPALGMRRAPVWGPRAGPGPTACPGMQSRRGADCSAVS